MLYFAYGSNMNLEQMGRRCRGAMLCGYGILHNYELKERKFADIQPSEEEMVFGALFQITSADLYALDRYEGYPRMYTRYQVYIDCGNATVPAIAYRMTPLYRHQLDGLPYSPGYREVCRIGAEECGLPENCYV